MGEGKVLYRDGNKERVIRGKVVDKGNFIEIHRRDRIIQLNKAIVLKIEKRGEDGDDILTSKIREQYKSL